MQFLIKINILQIYKLHKIILLENLMKRIDIVFLLKIRSIHRMILATINKIIKLVRR